MFGKRKGDKKMNLQDIFNANRKELNQLAERNTKRNEDGRTVVRKDDPWRNEDFHNNNSIITPSPIYSE